MSEGATIAAVEFQSAGSREPDPTSKTSSGCAYGFNPQARESLIEFSEEFTEGQISFNPQARESLIKPQSNTSSGHRGFNPQARESLIIPSIRIKTCTVGFNPQARESLIPRPFQASCRPLVFQSAGSREPDQETVIYTH